MKLQSACLSNTRHHVSPMASIEQIQILCREWEALPTLLPLERHLVQNMGEVAASGNMQEFEAFRDLLCGQFWKQIYSAIVKAREAGLNVKVS